MVPEPDARGKLAASIATDRDVSKEASPSVLCPVQKPPAFCRSINVRATDSVGLVAGSTALAPTAAAMAESPSESWLAAAETFLFEKDGFAANTLSRSS